MNEITDASDNEASNRPTSSQFAADLQELLRALKAGELVLELDPLEQLEFDLTSFLDHEWFYGVADDLELEDVHTRWNVTAVGEKHHLRIAIDAVVRPAR